MLEEYCWKHIDENKEGSFLFSLSTTPPWLRSSMTLLCGCKSLLPMWMVGGAWSVVVESPPPVETEKSHGGGTSLTRKPR